MSGGRVEDMACDEGSPEAAASGVDWYAQARKALSLRSPFDGEEAAARAPTLPARLASWAGHGDGRKKHKKAQPPEAGSAEKAPQPAAPAGMWEQFEEYFREITLDDIEMLVPKLPFSSNQIDSCLLVPFIGSGSERVEKVGTFDVPVAETSSNLGVGGEELTSNKERSEGGGEQGMHEVVVQQLERPLEVEQEQAGTSGIASPEHVGDWGTSLNWLLGAKDRFVLTSERPNKKRKLLGMDAGLDRLVLLPRLEAEACSTCDVCSLGETGMQSNSMLHCDACRVSVHQKCYGVPAVPEGRWLCAWCKHLESAVGSSRTDWGSNGLRPCALCPKEKGALKPAKKEFGRNAGGGNLKFVHLFCSLWMPEVLVEDMESMEPVINVGSVQENRRKLVCNVCKIKHGACVRCSHGTCRTSFHPICARESNHQMEIWGKCGHDNVEMRAFCSKHSTVQDDSSVQKSSNVAEDPTEARPNDANLVTAKIPKLRFTRKNKDTSLICETTSSSSDNLIKIETMELDTLPCTVRSVDSQSVRSKETDIDCPSGAGSLMRNSADVSVILRKMIDRGKVSVGDIASEVGISSESLEAALLGETTTFSPGLKLKISKWLQNFVHVPAVQVKTLKDSAVILQDNKLERIEAANAANMKNPYVPGDEKGAAVDMPDCVLSKSSPSRTKGHKRILKDNKEICASGVTPLQNGNKKIVYETADAGCSPAEDVIKETDGKLSAISSKDSAKKEDHQELISSNTSGKKELITHFDLPNENKGALVKRGSNDLAEAPLGSVVEDVSSFNHSFPQRVNFIDGATTVENGFHSCDFDADQQSGQPFFRFDGSHFYIHPFIKKKLSHLWDHNFKKNERERETYCHAEPSRPSHDQQHVNSSPSSEHKSEVAALDQVTKAKSLGILEHSPDDEVEGEIVYLQARLLDNAVAVKQRYEDLILKVVQNLSSELDAFNKRKWDSILVNQFLREVREAKKRGRKERRHKEAQAVLAAAAAAIAASSRSSALRKDADDNVPPANQENAPTLGSGSSRGGQPISLLPRTKDSSKLSNNKTSPDGNWGIFHMPNFSKENALYCDVCMRSETVLNRIFVCSSCKAAVHLDCYHSLKNPTGPWKCELCEGMPSPAASPSNQSEEVVRPCLAQCSLCGGTSGAFRKAIDGQWVHAFCAEWLLENKFTRGQDNLVDGMGSLLKMKDTCSICFRNVGACLKCSYGDCCISFHPSCARDAGFYMNVKGFGGMLQHKAYCGKHSMEQREADSQHYGPEELKSMKHMRVELEKLRLLCERIIKREKVKRDLAVCTNDILASKKDQAAFSVLRRSSFCGPGASSESATTSINNKSYSGTMQRSDDVTVDSTVSAKHTIRFSLHNRDADRNTADSSTSPLVFTRKLGDRGSLAGKQLPQRPTTTLQNSEEDGEKRSKDKKHRETFQKELVMTSDQASMQNQRLPKGYVYVPRGTLSKERPWNRGSDTHEPEEPGG